MASSEVSQLSRVSLEVPESIPNISSDEQAKIIAWLTDIEETDPTTIMEVVDKCRNNLNARRYFLKCSEEVSKPEPIDRIVR